MARLRLVPPDSRYRESFLAFIDELGAEAIRYREFDVFEDDDFDVYVADLRGSEDAAYQYLWLVEDEAVIGHAYVDYDRESFAKYRDGQVDYIIRPSKRRQGYGTRLLALLKEHGRARGMSRLLISCLRDNVGSRRIILANGGVPYGAVSDIFDRTRTRLQYTIDLEDTIPIPDRKELFDVWAMKYDTSVDDATFPFTGYEKVLDEAIAQAELWDGARALDVGTGTGNLAARLLAGGCGEVWGADFSEEMLTRARQKAPEAHFVRANLLEAWPDELPEQFDRIVSAYVFHEFDLETKLRLIGELNARLKPRGRLVIADIAFTTAEDREAAHRRWAGLWNEDEYYWAADEAIAALANAGIGARYVQVSICGGVFVIHRYTPSRQQPPSNEPPFEVA